MSRHCRPNPRDNGVYLRSQSCEANCHMNGGGEALPKYEPGCQAFQLITSLAVMTEPRPARTLLKDDETIPPSSLPEKRTVAPTRAATTWANDSTENHHSRSQTLPAGSSGARVARPPKIAEKGNSLFGSGYAVEELADAGLQGVSNQYLAPSMPMPDVRQSGSSFQTEPSSYYSADDNVSSYGPPPPMPVPNPVRKDTVERLYDDLWEAAQLVTTPSEIEAPPPMPLPPTDQHSGDDEESNRNHSRSWTPHQPLGVPDSHPQTYTMPSAAPAMPHANISTSSAAESIGVPNFPSPEHQTADGGAPVMPTAPLRVHHGAKPPSGTSPTGVDARPSYMGDGPPAPGMPSPTISSMSHGQSHMAHNQGHTASTGQSRPSGPTPQFNAFHAPGAGSSRPAAAPTVSAPHAQSSSAQPSGPVKASLGDQSSFYFDPVQKRWVNRKVDSSPPSRTETQQSSGLPPGAGASAFSSSRPSGSQTSIRPQAATTAASRPQPDSGGPHTPAGKPPTVVVHNSPSQSTPTVPQKPSSNHQANTRPQATIASAKPSVVSTPQQLATNRPQQNSALPTKTSVVVHPPQHVQDSPRPQNASTLSPAKTSNVLSTSQSNLRPQAAQNSRPQATSTSVSTHAQQSLAPKPSSSYNSVKPEPAPAPPKPAPSSSTPANGSGTGPKPDAKPAKMTGAIPTRRHGELSQFDTQYVNMLLALDDIPAIHNIAAGFFNWILLAGFILFPGTFASLQSLQTTDQVSARVIHAVTNVPLFVVAWVCCGLGASGMCWLWWRWRKNYLWAANKIFLPGLMNSLAGFISTLANIYGVQHGQYTRNSKITIIVTGVSLGIFLMFFLFYTFWLIRNVKKKHDREVGKQRTGKYGEGVVDLTKRKP